MRSGADAIVKGFYIGIESCISDEDLCESFSQIAVFDEYFIIALARKQGDLRIWFCAVV